MGLLCRAALYVWFGYLLPMLTVHDLGMQSTDHLDTGRQEPTPETPPASASEVFNYLTLAKIPLVPYKMACVLLSGAITIFVSGQCCLQASCFCEIKTLLAIAHVTKKKLEAGVLKERMWHGGTPVCLESSDPSSRPAPLLRYGIDKCHIDTYRYRRYD